MNINRFNHLQGKNVVVTGASGYLGSALTCEIKKYGARVICATRTLSKANTVDHHINGDIKDTDTCKKIVEQADIIYHLAANTSLNEARVNPELSLLTALLPIMHIVENAKKLNRCPMVVYTSTATIYGLTGLHPTSEDVKPNPITAYDLHKLYVEQQVELATFEGYIRGVSLRLANVYGPSVMDSSARDRGVLNKTIQRAFRGEEIIVFGDGNCVRDYVYINDVIYALIHASSLSQSELGVYNVGSGTGATIKTAFNLVVSEVNALTKKHAKVQSSPWPSDTLSIERRNYVADIKKFSSVGWNPGVKLEQGIKITCENMYKALL